MIDVYMVSNSGSGVPVRFPIVEGTTLEAFLSVHFEEGSPDDFVVKVRSNGQGIQVYNDYVLQDGDRVSLTPSKVEGAV